MSNEKPLHQVSAQGKICRGQKHSVEHLSCTIPLQIQKSSEIQFSVSFSSVNFSHAATVRLARCTRLFLPGQRPRTRAWRLPGVGGALGRPRRRVLQQPNPRGSRQGTERRLNAVRRRPMPLCSPRGLMHASARPWHRRHGPASTEHAHCRRWARAVPFCRTRP